MKKLEFNEENFDMLVERMHFLREEVKKYKYDHLTGLKLRKDFDEKLDRMYEAYEFEDQPFVFIMADADGLHNTNRTLGYDAGDELLITISSELRAEFGDCKNVDIFRISGDEFAVLMTGELCDDAINEKMKNVTSCSYASVFMDTTECHPSPSSVFKCADKKLTEVKMKNKQERI